MTYSSWWAPPIKDRQQHNSEYILATIREFARWIQQVQQENATLAVTRPERYWQDAVRDLCREFLKLDGILTNGHGPIPSSWMETNLHMMEDGSSVCGHCQKPVEQDLTRHINGCMARFTSITGTYDKE